MNWQGNVVPNIYISLYDLLRNPYFTDQSMFYFVSVHSKVILDTHPSKKEEEKKKKKKTTATTTKTKCCIRKSYQFTHRSINNQFNNRSLFPIIVPNTCKQRHILIKTACSLYSCQDSRLLYYFIREIKMWLNINPITVHNNTYILF